MGTIFFLSHQSGDSISLPCFPGSDKIAHMLAYGALAITVLWFFGKGGLDSRLRTAVFTVFFCLLYGLSDEFHQSFIPLRSVSGLDIIADVAGAIVVTFIWSKSYQLQKRISVME